MLLVYLAIVYASCVLGVLLELGRRLVLLDLDVQVLERRVYRSISFRDTRDRLQQGVTIDPMDIFEPASVPVYRTDLIGMFENTAVPNVDGRPEFLSSNARHLYESLGRSWALMRIIENGSESVAEEGERESRLREEKFRKRNVVAVEREMDCTDG
jgi:hypothetical protein